MRFVRAALLAGKMLAESAVRVINAHASVNDSGS